MQNRITVIPADKIIQVDGHGLNFNFPAPANMHALQWHDGTGHIEYTDGQANRPLTAADYDVEVAPFTALWQAEYDRLEEERNRPLTPEEIAQNAYVAAVSELLTVDAKSIRAMRVLLLALAGTNPDAVATLERDLTKLSDLETQAETLRSTLRGFLGEP